MLQGAAQSISRQIPNAAYRDTRVLNSQASLTRIKKNNNLTKKYSIKH